MYQTLLVVVLSGKTYKDSATLNCLMNKAYVNCDLIIINTGPDALQFDKDFIHTLGFYVKSIDIKEYLDALLLGKIYNEILNEYCEIERFVFLDDDSFLNKNYLNNLDRFYATHIDLQIPNIRSKEDGKVYFPIIDESVTKVADGMLISAAQDIRSLGFGLVVYRSAINKFSEIHKLIFDNHFSFYDVDNGFFGEIKLLSAENIGINIQVVNTLEHTLNCSSGIDSKWRVIERIKEAILPIKSHFTN
ncbi:hypothetical protein [Pantoea sp. At-9b]|uniref:hypothetical protein n=1 Tax=Pantoea sp. (strain At-9b) TaxID=592316 RepID=UPI0001B3F7D3|nr:hypothetical protein [Pantoea sp. At-9b]ADU72295.1 conserved hypothetical protein [Pantoea sp. At-9b]